jgi:hypothetical protein
MTITSQTTRQGKVFHRLSPYDLVDVVASGQRLRAYCPIHGSDHQRSLSIDSSTGLGFCHCCHATVLVETGDAMIHDRGESKDERRRADNETRSPPSCIASLLSSSLQPDPARRVPLATPLPRWQQEEVAALIAIASTDARVSGFIQVGAGIPHRTRYSFEHRAYCTHRLCLTFRLGACTTASRATAALAALDWTHRLPAELTSWRRVHRAHAAQVGTRHGRERPQGHARPARRSQTLDENQPGRMVRF